MAKFTLNGKRVKNISIFNKGTYKREKDLKCYIKKNWENYVTNIMIIAGFYHNKKLKIMKIKKQIKINS